MADFGMKVAPKTKAIHTAADYELLFSSGWPVLRIAAQGSFTIADSGVAQDIYTHGLGYAPVYWVFDTADATASHNPEFVSGPFYNMNSTKLHYLADGGGPGGSTFTGYYYVFRYNLQTAFVAPTLQTSATGKQTGDTYGVKIAPGKSIASTDLRDYSLNSASRLLQIHRSDYGSGAGVWTHTINHLLNYEPCFMVWVDLLQNGEWNQLGGQAQNQFTYADTLNLTLGANTTMNWASVIFKDPFQLVA